MHSPRLPSQLIRHAVAMAVAFTLLGAGSAAAKSCPNSSISTVHVAASPQQSAYSYTYTRGCIVSFDGTSIVYNLFEPLNPASRSVYPILEGPGWGGAGATRP